MIYHKQLPMAEMLLYLACKSKEYEESLIKVSSILVASKMSHFFPQNMFDAVQQCLDRAGHEYIAMVSERIKAEKSVEEMYVC